MARPPSPNLDPAADAAALLRRLGFGTLLLLVPLAALLTRRGVVVLVPIGIFLLVIAAALDGAHRAIGPTLARLIRSRAGLGAAVVLVWCALSLIWTPFPAAASERLANIATTAVFAAAGYLALPDRMRSANLYLVPLGIVGAAILAILLALFGWPGGRASAEAGQNLDRGLTVLAVMAWPAVSWLRSRGRHFEALGVAVLAAIAAVLGPQPIPALALAAGGIVFGLTVARRRFGLMVAASLMAGLLALAPLIPFLLRPVASAFMPGSATGRSLAVWRNAVTSEPVRLITGHGFETALRGRFGGLLPVNAPNTLLFEVWYELGIVGALAFAFALYAGTLASGRSNPALVPGIAAAIVTAFAVACLGVGAAQMWWQTALAVVALAFVAIERGQFRTTRPKARLMQAARR
jgi:hypothetical protein